MSFQLPNLPYAYDALEPHIDARTMEIHHTKHHNAYLTKLNGAISGTDMEGKSIEALLNGLALLGWNPPHREDPAYLSETTMG